MDMQRKAVIYKYMFLISTVSGALGIYFLFFKDKLHVLGWILIGIWGVLAILVRILIMRDKKYFKKNKV